MSVEEGLSSEDSEVIKKARGAAKGKVTNKINFLQNLLLKDDGKFLFDQIDRKDVQDQYSMLEECHETFQDLHQRFYLFRKVLEDGGEEKKLLDKEDSYSKQVMQSFCSVKAEYTKYKNSVELLIKADAIQSARLQLDFAKTDAQEVIASDDDDKLKKTAESINKKLKSAFDVLVAKIEDFKAASKTSGEKEETLKTEYTEEGRVVHKLILQLASITISNQEKSGDSKSQTVTKGQSVDRTSIVKLQKMSCPKFSGYARDFSHFKRDFNAMVNVVGRSDVEIGSNLLNAVPTKYQHLIDNLDMSNHQEMMKVLTSKFGSSRLVIDDIVSQMEKLKAITTDKGFVEFVEKLEKIKLDLETLEIIGEIANSTVIGKLESKLPTLISIDWSKIVTDEEVDAKS